MASARLTHNFQKVRKSVLDTQGRYTIATRKLARQVGREGRDNVRANVTPKSIGGVFPGYAMTSTLWRRVVASAAKKKAKAWTVRVRVLLTGKVKKYAEIHETGGIIRAKNKPYLVFKVLGRWVRVKQVRITRKQYFKKGIEKTRKTTSLGAIARKLF